MKTSLKKITLAVLPLVAFLFIAPSSALARNNHKHRDHDSYSRRYNDNDDDCRHDWNRYTNRLSRDRGNRYYDGRYDGRYYEDGYYNHPRRSRSPYTNDLPRYYGSPYGSPYGNPSSYYPPSDGALPWLDLLFPRY